MQGLTAGLPSRVAHPYGMARSRLLSKLPPEPPKPAPVAYVMECTECGVPGPPEALPGGLCRVCRCVPYVPEPGLPADVVRGKAERLRETVRMHRGSRAASY